MEQPKQPPAARVIVVGQAAWQQPDGDPAAVEIRWVRQLTSAEQPLIKRRLTVGPSWRHVDAAWLQAASLILLNNLEGQNPQVIPTLQEAAETESRVVELRFAPPTPSDQAPHVLCRPGCTAGPFEPASLASVFARCRSGEARVLLSAFPE